MSANENGLDDSPKAHYGKVDDARLSAEEMDSRRKETMAYEYLCHLEEAKIWIEACINETLPASTEIEEGLRNGVHLAKLGHFMAPDVVPLKKIYDKDQSRYQVRGLHFRHTDNINHWLRGLEDVGLPKIFYPETTDIYDRKNMPRTIYCLHALSLYLFKLGKAPQIQDLYGKIKFTDEEISNMRRELEKYGIQMPAFSKIGGILANEMPVDEAALHAAVIAINDALMKKIAQDTLVTLQNPAAHLMNVSPDLDQMYQDTLYEAKETKTEIARNKSMDPESSYIPDAYDELLTQAEIQGNINIVNVQHGLSKVSEAVKKRDVTRLNQALHLSALGLRDVKEDFVDLYLAKFSDIQNDQQTNNNEANSLTKDVVQMTIRAANAEGDTEAQRVRAIQQINMALEKKDDEEIVNALQNPHAQLPGIENYAGPLYHEELLNMKNEKQSNLDYDEVFAGVQVLSAIAEINRAVEMRDTEATLSALMDDNAHIQALESELGDRYYQALASCQKSRQRHASNLLTHAEVQQCVNEVNTQAMEENNQVQAIGRINEAIDEGVAQHTLATLMIPAAHLENVKPENSWCYQQLLKEQKSQRGQELDDPSAVLWYQDIQEVVNEANQQTEDAFSLSVVVAGINIAIDTEDVSNLLNCLGDERADLHNVTPECAEIYLSSLKRYREEKMEAGEHGSGWMMNRAREGHKFYFNVHSMEYGFERPDGVKKDYSLLTREEIQNCVADVTAAHNRQLLFKSNERFIVLLQARVRGCQARKQYRERHNLMCTQIPAVLKIQSWWRMLRERRKYLWRMQYLHSQMDAAVKIQTYIRMYNVRRKYLSRLNFLNRQVNAVIKLQAFMRSNWAKKDYRALMQGNSPTVSVVRKFVHLLDVGDTDYSEEIELERLRQQVVIEIRSNQRLEKDLNIMDIKIGLLVKNRITLQDVVSQHKTLKQYRNSSAGSSQSQASNTASGLKALSKQSRERLEAYQHLFYLLQTHPVYLARLIFEMPQSKTTKFMESVILTLYNYASNEREEYLLLRLFKKALEEEIRSKVNTMSDIVTGNPMVVKMIVSFNRNARGQGALRELLNPLVKSIIDDKSLQINTNPVEVYKQWVNQMETESGKPSGLPYDVTTEEALNHPEVVERIGQSVKSLEKATENVLSEILNSVDLVPYGMRYMAKVLKDSLQKKFPEAPEKDILKIVGNLIYYRYINSAIVAPDAFDIIDTGVNKSLTNDQRRNLGSVAKILQFAASNKGFGGDSSHLSSMNKYIMEAHTRFKAYFQSICAVEEPEVQFNMDQFTDLTRITKPVIYISIAEIIDTHKLLLEHEDSIAHDSTDVLHELLLDLGEAPEVESLIGDSGTEDPIANKAQLSKTEISLMLSNKFEVPESDQGDLKSLFIRMKRMLVDVIRCQRSGDTLMEILGTETNHDEENEHSKLVKQRDLVDQKIVNKKSKLVRHQSMLGEMRLPLQQMKAKILNALQELEKAGYIGQDDKYQGVLNSIVQDIRNQRMYRHKRKQEMTRLRATLKSLETKRVFYEEQIDYYNQYVKTCLDNLSTKSKRSSKNLNKRNSKIKESIKYSAAKLQEKGVIIEIEGLPTSQTKNVLFEIHSTEKVGVFDVNAKFLGVNMETVELVFQDLLQLQYEGVAVMKMYTAKVNVNLLIFLLNKKFYGK